MAAEETDHQNTGPILQGSHQPIVIAFNVEDHPAAFQDACPRMRRLNILRIVPFRPLRNPEPYIVLRPRRPDSSVAGMGREVPLDGVRADYDHRLKRRT
jgi:hypothetical protein